MKEKITRTGIKQSVKELIKTSPQLMLTVKKISLASGISRTSFYASFENLEDVLLELQEDFMDEIYKLYFCIKIPWCCISYLNIYPKIKN